MKSWTRSLGFLSLACLVFAAACAGHKATPQGYAVFEHEKCVSKTYAEAAAQTIRKNWLGRMPLAVRAGIVGTVSLRFDIASDGAILNLSTLNRSGPEPMERAATKAVEDSSPLPVPEFGDSSCRKETVTIHFYYSRTPEGAQVGH